MTFGQKLKAARTQAGMTQKEVADKLLVSRQAVTKWENDKGLPDIENLKTIAKLLNVSVDYLLDDGTALDMSVVREAIALSEYGTGRKKQLKDRVVRSRYPNAEIMALMGEEKLTKAEKIIDNVILFVTPLMDMIKLAKGLNNLSNEFYLVNDGDIQYLVVVTDEYIESRRLAEKITDKKFEIGGYLFRNCGPIKYA